MMCRRTEHFQNLLINPMRGIKSDLAGNFNVPSQTSSRRIDACGDYEVPGSARRIVRWRERDTVRQPPTPRNSQLQSEGRR